MDWATPSTCLSLGIPICTMGDMAQGLLKRSRKQCMRSAWRSWRGGVPQQVETTVPVPVGVFQRDCPSVVASSKTLCGSCWFLMSLISC